MKLFQQIARRFGWSGNDPGQPERLIDIPVLREPSADLLRRLRLLDDRAEVVYIGNGRWWVGRVKPNSPRRKHGRRQAFRARQSDGFRDDNRWPVLRQGLLMAQGFGLVVNEFVQGEPDGFLVAEFEKALFVERGGQLEDTAETLYEKVLSDIRGESKLKEQDLTKWAFNRLGRRNPIVGGGSNEKLRRVI